MNTRSAPNEKRFDADLLRSLIRLLYSCRITQDRQLTFGGCILVSINRRAELYLARAGIARGRDRRLERSAQGCDRRRVGWREDSGDDRVGIDRDHGIVAGIDAFGRARRACATDRVRIATVDAAIISGSSAGPSGDGFDV